MNRKELGKEARLFRKRKGFNLVELLIAVVIIALLTMIVIPSARVSINRARLKTTMKNVNSISRALSDYIIDNGIAPPQNGPYDTNSSVYVALVPFYSKILPIHDQWGNGFRIWCKNDADGIYVITNPGDNDFLIASFGRDHIKEDDFTFSTLLPEDGYYYLKEMSDFNKDLVMWNGAWIRRPYGVGD
jgi:prepilin-type N-terminal cleavage/methylation domain-containing protein